MSKDSIQNMEMQVFVFSDLTLAFKIVDTDGFDGPLNVLNIVNTMNVPVIISFNGQYGHGYIRASDSIDINAQFGSTVLNKRNLFQNKTKVYVKRASNVPKSGALIVTGFYQE